MTDQIIRIPMESNTPTESEYRDMCTKSDSAKPSCVLNLIELTGSSVPSIESGELQVVTVPLKPTNVDRSVEVGVWLVRGCPVDPALSWDAAGSSETITRNNSIAISIRDGLGDYHWELLDDAGAGDGFSLATNITLENNWTNILYANNDACGMVRIRVTDECDSVVTSSVRCTDSGHWVRTCDTWTHAECNFDALGWDEVVGTEFRYTVQFTKTVGGYRYSEEIVGGEGAFTYENYCVGRCTYYLFNLPFCYEAVGLSGGICDRALPDGCDGMHLNPDLTCGGLIGIFHSLGWTDMVVTNFDEVGPCCENILEPDAWYGNKFFCWYPHRRWMEEWVCR